MTLIYDNSTAAAKKVIATVGKTIVIGVPLGIGKPIELLNALYEIACADSTIQLTIITGLTLARPILHHPLEKRLIEPILDRLLKNYVDPLYEQARLLQQLPSNIKVIEFFLSPGKFLHNQYVQENYISSSYTNVIRDTIHFSINVLAQQITRAEDNPDNYSLSCNSDLFHTMQTHLRGMEKNGKKIAIIGEVNLNLPFMYGEALVQTQDFSDLIDTHNYPALFAIPREELSAQDHLIGLYTSALIKDDGCLQIGIGKLSNAVANALIFRQIENTVYCDLLNELAIKEKFGTTLLASGSLTPFTRGLYASTEMFSDEYMALYNAGILKKRVYDHLGLQKLANLHQLNETITPDVLDMLLEHKIIHAKLSAKDIEFLQKYGVFKSDILYHQKQLILSSGEKIAADLSIPTIKETIIRQCLGEKWLSGIIIHAGFFVGSTDLYSQLNNLSTEEMQQISMASIARTNSLLLAPKLFALQRQQARFVNSALMITLGGAVVSDGLTNYQEVSGVGGQFDFVNMATQLEGARSIINCRSTRQTSRGVESNIIWDYANITIPRYLRDIIITEYGIADCRSKTDVDVIKSILQITDTRFQTALLNKAKKAGKLPGNYEIPTQFKNNYPENIKKIHHKLQAKGLCNPYPFGSDLTSDEQVIASALLYLKNCSKLKKFILSITGFCTFTHESQLNKYLQRMNLLSPKSIKDYCYQKILISAIRQCSNS